MGIGGRRGVFIGVVGGGVVYSGWGERVIWLLGKVGRLWRVRIYRRDGGCCFYWIFFLVFESNCFDS